MSEQPNEQTNPQPKIEILLIDNPANFPFHAAYLVYEESFDKANDPNSKLELNQNIQDLYEGKIDNATFYMNVSRYRKVDAPRQERFSMQTQRKETGAKKSNAKTGLSGIRSNQT